MSDYSELSVIAENLYFNNTNRHIETSQTVPYFNNKAVWQQVDFFSFDRLERIVGTNIRENQLCFFTNDIIFTNEMRKKKIRLIRNADLGSLITAQRMVEPFLLFINKRFIKWSDIKLWSDERYVHLNINIPEFLKDTEVESIELLHLPFKVTYTEDNDIDDDKTLIFIFDNKGEHNYEGRTRIYLDQDFIVYLSGVGSLNRVYRESILVTNPYQIYNTNVVLFKNGLLDRDSDIIIDPYQNITIDNGSSAEVGWDYKVFRDQRVNYPENNVNQVRNHAYLENAYFENDPVLEYFNILHQNFDFQFDPEVDYTENIKKFFQYVCAYNYKLIVDRLSSANVEVESYKIDKIGQQNGIATLLYPKRFRGNCSVMVFINGTMQNSKITEIQTYGFSIDVSEYESESCLLELVYFRNYSRLPSLPIKTNKEEHTYYAFAGYDEVELYSKYSPDKVFTMQDESQVFYLVDESEYDYIGNKIIFKSDTYLDQEIWLTPKRKYAYNKFLMPTDNYRVIMGDEFNFCNVLERYMVFVNGRKLNTSMYRVIVPQPTLPFNNRAIYFHRMLKAGDLVEVIYSPMSLISETYIEDLDHSSIDGTGIDQLGYITGPIDYPVPLSYQLQFYFISGYKMPARYINDISYHMVRITQNVRSVEDLCIVSVDDDLVNQLIDLNLTKSLLDQFYDYFDKNTLNILTKTYSYITNVVLAEKADFDKATLIRQIIRDYYALVNEGAPFRYDYDASTFVEVDAGGNIILDIVDGNVFTGLDIEEKEET